MLRKNTPKKLSTAVVINTKLTLILMFKWLARTASLTGHAIFWR